MFDKIQGHKFRHDLLSSNPLIMDCGSKWGEFVIPFLKKYGGRCLCVEPDPTSIKEMHRRAVKIYKQIEVLQGALWIDNEGVIINMWPNAPSANSIFDKAKSGSIKTRVNTFTLKECLDKLGDTIDIMKLDIEGAEWEILFNAGTLLQRVKQLTGELHCEFSEGKTLDDLENMLEANGFAIQITRSEEKRPRFDFHAYRITKKD